MNIYIRIILTLIVINSLGSCTSNFEETNTDSNFPENSSPEAQFRGICWRLSNTIAINGWEIGNKLAQLTTNHDFNDFDRYDRLVNSTLWDTLYVILRDINLMLEKTEVQESYRIYHGPLLTLKAYVAGTLTDIWGNVPFTEAGNGINGELTPRYDTQEELYLGNSGILNLLTESALVSETYTGNNVLRGDIIYEGDLSKWIKLANSLKLRHLLRASDKIPNVGNEIQQTIEKGVLESNADNAKVEYLTIDPNRWFLADARPGDVGLTLMTTAVEELLNLWNDPRIAVIFQPNSIGEYKGIASGVNEAWKEENGFNVSNFSNFNFSRYLEPDSIDAILINYSEVNFSIAEAIEKGLISGDALFYYNEGILSNFDYLGLEFPDGYLDNENINLTTVSNKIEAIINQKWIANFGVGFEGFFNHRRSGYPNLLPSVGNVNNNIFPVRFLYPETEQALNSQNYLSNLSNQGEDSINTVFWLLQ